MSEKYKSPFPDRQLKGKDFNDLVNHLNKVIDKSDLSQDRLNNVESKIQNFNDTIDVAISKFYRKQEESENQINDTLDRVEKLKNRLEGFYAKIIEIVGIFIAVFAIIITGIQISTSMTGTFTEIFLKSSAIFIPIVVSIILLIFMIKWIIKK